MSEEEWLAVDDVWRLTSRDRWRLYNCWASLFCQEKCVHLRHLSAEYNRCATRLTELNAQADYQVLWFGVTVEAFVARLVLGWVTVFWRLYHLRACITKPARSTQRCIPPGSLNQVPALIGWCGGGNVTSAGWQVTLRNGT